MDPGALNLDFSVSSILGGIIFGVIGLWALRQGKKDANIRVMALGLGLMVYPYFTPTAVWTWSVGVVLCFLLKLWW